MPALDDLNARIQATTTTRKRSPLLVAAYCTLTYAYFLAFLKAGVLWSVGAAALAILLALGSLLVRWTKGS
jgi:hypothetical protein